MLGYYRNIALIAARRHNEEMGVSSVFLDFLQHTVIGAAAVFALLFLIHLGIPRRSVIEIPHRTIR